MVAGLELRIAFIGRELEAGQHLFESRHIGVERLRARHQHGAFITPASEQAHRVVDHRRGAVAGAQLECPFQVFGRGVVMGRRVPAIGEHLRQTELAPLRITGRVALLDAGQQRVGVDLVVVLDIAAVIERKRRPPVARDQNAFFGSQVARELQKLRAFLLVEKLGSLGNRQRGLAFERASGRAALPGQRLHAGAGFFGRLIGGEGGKGGCAEERGDEESTNFDHLNSALLCFDFLLRCLLNAGVVSACAGFVASKTAVIMCEG